MLHSLSYDDNKNRLITNFDVERLRVYEIAVKEFESKVFLRGPEENYKITGYRRNSLWIKNGTSDLSDFWRYHEKIEKNINRIKKLERINER